MNEIVYRSKITYSQLGAGYCFIHNNRMLMKLDRRDDNGWCMAVNLANGQTIVLCSMEEVTPVRIKIYEICP